MRAFYSVRMFLYGYPLKLLIRPCDSFKTIFTFCSLLVVCSCLKRDTFFSTLMLTGAVDLSFSLSISTPLLVGGGYGRDKGERFSLSLATVVATRPPSSRIALSEGLKKRSMRLSKNRTSTYFFQSTKSCTFMQKALFFYPTRHRGVEFQDFRFIFSG